MPNVVGVRFKKNPKTYYFEAGTHTYTKGCDVLVETARGLEMGSVDALPKEVDEKDITPPLKPVIRIADEADLMQQKRLMEKRDVAIKTAAEKIAKSGLEMKLADAEYTFDGSKLILYFTAGGRVDFRDLVRELASTFKVRIELRQIGTRDECKLKGGLGPCGRPCCCSRHLNEFEHVTIRMAKNQNLSLNPAKISGLCNRLMCCLAYENAHYAETNKKMPKIGSEAEAVDGKKGIVSDINQLKETVTLKISDKDIFVFETYPLDKIKRKGAAAADDISGAADLEELKGLED